jgi:hypothetical protein
LHDKSAFPAGQWLGTYQKDFGNDRYEFDDTGHLLFLA